MKIRTQFMISAVVLGGFLLLVSASEIITNLWIQKINQQEELAAQIERQAYELGYLANDYLLYRESQQASRWESKFASFSNDLSKIDVNTPEQQALLANIKTNQQRQKAVFAEVRASIESASQTQEAGVDAKFMQVSWSRLEVQNQGMIFDASRLERMLREQENQLRQTTSLLSFVLIGVFGIFLWVNYGLTFQRTLRAIARLQEGTRIIGSGDLDFAIAVKNEDEIGELSRAFNQMTTNLKQVTASKADLEKEIIERKQAQQALVESETRITSLYATMTEGLANHEVVYEVGEVIDYIITDVNPAYEQITGLSRSKVVGRKASELYGTGKPPYLEIYVRVAASGVPENFETYFPPMDKSFAISVFSPGKGKFATLFVDITERKQAEEIQRQLTRTLAQRLAELQTLMDVAPVGIAIGHDPEGQVITVNRLLSEWLSAPAGANVSLSAAEEERQVSYQVLRKGFPARAEELPIQYAALNARGVRNDELSIVRSDGRTIEMLANAEPLFDDQGQVRGSIASYIDITERKQAEAEQARLASFPERNPNPIAEIDYFGTIFYLNPKSLTLFPDLASSGLKHPLLVGLESFIQKFKAGDLEMIFTREVKAGEAYYHQTIVNIPESKHIRLYSVNITERKQVEETLARQAEDLRRSNTELEQFAYVASHDLQEPLRIMSNFSQLLERRYKGRLDQDADEFIGFIVDAASRMQKLITDLLAYSRVGHGNTHMVEVDCDRLVHNLVESMAVTIETADGQVTFDRLPIIKAHETSLIQLFQNLMGNAIKFRGEQPPRIHISARQTDDEWVFSVADNGIGIEPQYNQRIFMIFQRLHSREKYAGTGIGLSICKKIVENMGGRIWVESESGRGSTFIFTVPVNVNTKGEKND